MEIIDRYRRSLKRKNYAAHTVKAYMNVLAQFTRWLDAPVERVTRSETGAYVDHLFQKRLSPKTVTCHLQIIRAFYEYLINEEGMVLTNPVSKISIRLPKPLPRHLKDDQVANLFSVITKARDRAMFMLMLRSGLRVEEVAHLTVDAVEYQRRELFVSSGKGAKDRMVYLSDDACVALAAYLEQRSSKAKQLFLVEKGPMKGKPISVRGIQKRIEYYARESGLNVSCHCLRHTLATQLLNADADLSSIRDLLGHTHITTTQRYCRVANLKVRRDYHKAMEVVLQRMQALEEDDEYPRSHPREHRGYRERMARDHRTRGEETLSPILVMKKRKEVGDVGERQERVAP
jgi:site-specific recombinase XerD